MNFFDTAESFRQIDEDFQRIVKRQSHLDDLIKQLEELKINFSSPQNLNFEGEINSLVSLQKILEEFFSSYQKGSKHASIKDVLSQILDRNIESEECNSIIKKKFGSSKSFLKMIEQ